MRSFTKSAALCSVLSVLTLSLPLSAQEKPKLYNTAKQKLLDGKQVFSHTVSTFDPEAYCEAAKHYDYTWFEMQHATLTFADIEKMILTCPKAGAIPMIRMADELESSIQHATDIGCLGIVMPTVDTVEKALQTAKYARYPPVGRRSQGRNNGAAIWGANYRQTFNDNMLVIVMIETPTGVANAYEIAKVPGIDVVILGNSDLTNFSGFLPNDPRYQQMLVDVRDATLKAGKFYGNANANLAKDNPISKDSRFHQNGPSNDGWQPPARGGRVPTKK